MEDGPAHQANHLHFEMGPSMVEMVKVLLLDHKKSVMFLELARNLPCSVREFSWISVASHVADDQRVSIYVSILI